MSDKLDRIEARPVDVLPDRVLLTKDERDALVEIARAAQQMFVLNDDEAMSDEAVQEAHDILRAALARLDTEERT